MKYCGILLLVIVVFAGFFPGCSRPSDDVRVTPAVPVTTPLIPPAPVPASVTMAAGTTVPRQVVTLIHYISVVKDIKDPDLLFALQVPVEWNVTTHRLTNSLYQTDLAGNGVFSIQTYAISGGQDQVYGDQFRKWTPAPKETTVTLNQITFDRFESSWEGKAHVAYVARRSSANERGYASVLLFAADTGSRFEKEDFEKVVSSFRYFRGRSAGTEPGEEILLYDESGRAVSRASGGRSLAWGEWEGDSSTGGDSSGNDSSGGGSGGSSGGCGCGGG